jgi:hypothetical protein
MPCGICQRLRNAIARNVVFVAAIVLVSLALAGWLSPWFGAGTHPLIVKADLEPGAKITAALSDGWTAPLVKTDDGYYATELPPRRDYTLNLRSDGGAARIAGIEILDLHVRPVGILISLKPASPMVVAKGSDAAIVRSLAVTHGEFWKAFAAFFVLLLLLGYGVAALVKKGDGPAKVGGGFRLWQWAVLFALASVHVWLVVTGTPVFWAADSIGYAGKAMQIYEHGSYYTNGVYYEITRAPGAPLIEALAFVLFGVSAASVALLQSVLYCAAAAFALDAVARVGSRWVALAFAPFVLIDPAAVSICRTFASEAPFAIFALLAAACMLRSINSRGRREWAWAVLALLASVYAVMVRPNGLIMLAFPIFMLGRLAFGAIRERAWPSFRAAAMWGAIIAASMAALLAWSWRNYCVQGYFAPTDIVGLSAAEANFKSGILDVRASSDDEAFYDELIKARRATNYNFEAWSLATLYRPRVEGGKPAEKSAAKQVDLMEKAFAARTNAASPVESRAARFARIFRWGVFLDTDPNYQPYGPPFQGFIIYPDEDWKRSNDTIGYWSDKRFCVPQMPLGRAQIAFNEAMAAYKWFVIVGALAALAAFAFSCWKVRLAALVFLLPYFGNILLNAWLGVVVSRYVYVLEPFMLLGIAACVAECVGRRGARTDKVEE